MGDPKRLENGFLFLNRLGEEYKDFAALCMILNDDKLVDEIMDIWGDSSIKVPPKSLKHEASLTRRALVRRKTSRAFKTEDSVVSDEIFLKYLKDFKLFDDVVDKNIHRLAVPHRDDGTTTKIELIKSLHEMYAVRMNSIQSYNDMLKLRTKYLLAKKNTKENKRKSD